MKIILILDKKRADGFQGMITSGEGECVVVNVNAASVDQVVQIVNEQAITHVVVEDDTSLSKKISAALHRNVRIIDPEVLVKLLL
jgi:ribosome maturation factor RimP